MSALATIATSLRAVADALDELGRAPVAAPAQPVPDVLSPGDVAAVERVSVSFVLRAIKRGELRASKLGPRVWRIERAAYEEWKRARVGRRRVV